VDTTSKLLFGVGAALALVVGLAVYLAVSSAQAFGRSATTVVVTRQAIPERTLFTGGNVDQLLTTRQLPTDVVPADALTRPGEAIGKANTMPLAAGEIVLGTADRLASGEGASARPAATIPRDKVALAIPATDTVAVAGAVQPGDRVDVIANWTRTNGQAVAQDIFQDVRVFAVGPWRGSTGGVAGAAAAATSAATGGAAGPTSAITLLLDYQQAVVLEYLLQNGGHVSLALRRFDQGDDVPTEAVTAESLNRRLLGDAAAPAAVPVPTPLPSQ
jgi:pilus assembly protein CpaB